MPRAFRPTSLDRWVVRHWLATFVAYVCSQSCVMILVLFAVWWFDALRPAMLLSLMALALLFPIVHFVIIQRAGTYVRSMRRFAGPDDTGCRLCTQCAYDLRASAPIGVCPECNAPYTSVSLEQTWTHRFPLSFVLDEHAS